MAERKYEIGEITPGSNREYELQILTRDEKGEVVGSTMVTVITTTPAPGHFSLQEQK